MRLFQNPKVVANFALWMKVGEEEERRPAVLPSEKLGQERVGRIIELKRRRLSNRDIAVTVGCHPNTVAKYLKRGSA
jgi:hypothetical protein